MTNFYGGLFLLMQWALKIPILRHWDSHDLILTAAGPMKSIIHGISRKRANFFLLLLLILMLRPLKLKSMIFHFPMRPSFGSFQALKLSLRIHKSIGLSVNIGLFNSIEGRTSRWKHGSTFLIIFKMESICSIHPIRHILTVSTE